MKHLSSLRSTSILQIWCTIFLWILIFLRYSVESVERSPGMPHDTESITQLKTITQEGMRKLFKNISDDFYHVDLDRMELFLESENELMVVPPTTHITFC